MFEKILNFLGNSNPPKKEGKIFGEKVLSHKDFVFIREVVDSCKLEVQIASAIGWIHSMYRKGFFSTETYHELIHHAIYREEAIIKEKVQKEVVWPHLKKRADEIKEEERRKNIRIVKTETGAS